MITFNFRLRQLHRIPNESEPLPDELKAPIAIAQDLLAVPSAPQPAGGGVFGLLGGESSSGDNGGVNGALTKGGATEGSSDRAEKEGVKADSPIVSFDFSVVVFYLSWSLFWDRMYSHLVVFWAMRQASTSYFCFLLFPRLGLFLWRIADITIVFRTRAQR